MSKLCAERRPRTTTQQQILLEQTFKDTPYPPKHVKSELSRTLGISLKSVTIVRIFSLIKWFQNRRVKQKVQGNKMERKETESPPRSQTKKKTKWDGLMMSSSPFDHTTSLGTINASLKTPLESAISNRAGASPIASEPLSSLTPLTAQSSLLTPFIGRINLKDLTNSEPLIPKNSLTGAPLKLSRSGSCPNIQESLSTTSIDSLLSFPASASQLSSINSLRSFSLPTIDSGVDMIQTLGPKFKTYQFEDQSFDFDPKLPSIDEATAIFDELIGLPDLSLKAFCLQINDWICIGSAEQVSCSYNMNAHEFIWKIKKEDLSKETVKIIVKMASLEVLAVSHVSKDISKLELRLKSVPEFMKMNKDTRDWISFDMNMTNVSIACGLQHDLLISRTEAEVILQSLSEELSKYSVNVLITCVES